MTDGRVKFSLGEHEYVAVPQRIGYLQNRLGPQLSELASLAVDDGKSMVGVQAYRLLAALCPKQGFMPEHEFMGYATAEAYESGEYDEDLDASPSPPEIFNALKAIATVNGGDAVDFLRQLLGPETIGKLVNLVLATALDSGSSPSLPQPNGASAQTSSGTSELTLQD